MEKSNFVSKSRPKGPRPTNTPVGSRMVLCRCGGRCPEVFVNPHKKKVVIRDDYGGQVTLTFEEFEQLKEKAKIDE